MHIKQVLQLFYSIYECLDLQAVVLKAKLRSCSLTVPLLGEMMVIKVRQES